MSASMEQALPPLDSRCEHCGGSGWLWLEAEIGISGARRGEWRRCRACPGTGRVDRQGGERTRPSDLPVLERRVGERRRISDRPGETDRRRAA
jgi:hypothetical protein